MVVGGNLGGGGTVVYDHAEPYRRGKRGESHSDPFFDGGAWLPLSKMRTGDGMAFTRYALYSDRLVLKFFWKEMRVIPLRDIEKVTFWYASGGRAQVLVRGSDDAPVLCTGHPVELGEAFDGLGVKIEAIEPAIYSTLGGEQDEGET